MNNDLELSLVITEGAFFSNATFVLINAHELKIN
jgi:hypothetical protein